MKTECYMQGTCIKCGCTTTALQMANKSCDEPCYPEMMNKEEWEFFVFGHVHIDSKGRWKLEKSTSMNKKKLVYYLNSEPEVERIIYPTNKELL